jgi:hypothetical protein
MYDSAMQPVEGYQQVQSSQFHKFLIAANLTHINDLMTWYEARNLIF